MEALFERNCYKECSANATANEIIALLKMTAHELGKCVIVVTHSKHLAEEADEIIRIKDGNLLFQMDYSD